MLTAVPHVGEARLPCPANHISLDSPHSRSGRFPARCTAMRTAPRGAPRRSFSSSHSRRTASGSSIHAEGAPAHRSRNRGRSAAEKLIGSSPTLHGRKARRARCSGFARRGSSSHTAGHLHHLGLFTARNRWHAAGRAARRLIFRNGGSSSARTTPRGLDPRCRGIRVETHRTHDNNPCLLGWLPISEHEQADDARSRR